MKKIFSLTLISSIFLISLTWAGDIEELQKRLEQRDRVIQELEERIERLERQVLSEVRREGKAIQGEELEERIARLEEEVDGNSIHSLIKNLKLSGFLDVSYNFNFNNAEDRINDFRIFDADENTFRFHLGELSILKEITEEFPFGFRLDLDFGKDVKVFAARGFDADDFEVQEAFVTYKTPFGVGLSFGKFVTLLGAEVIESIDNFNMSRSFLFGFAIPFTHTGILADYAFYERFHVTFGIVNGWDNVDDNNDGKTVIGQMSVNPLKNFNLTVSGIYGPEQDDTTSPKRWVVDVIATYNPMDRLTLQLNYDYGSEDEAVLDIFGQKDDARWQGIAAYINYNFTENIGLALRGEYFEDEDGARTGFPQDLWETTSTLHYRFHENMVVRLEYRHDESNKRLFHRNEKNKNSQDTVSLEFIYSF